ncbi:MAG: FkbM family methyltransferase [Bdellovibrionia bacterium]
MSILFWSFSFEPNSLHRLDLQRIKVLFGFNKFKYYLVGLGDRTEALQLFFPVVQGVPLSQEATLSRVGLLEDQTTQRRIFDLTGHSTFSIQESKITLNKLDDFGFRPDFVKLDVQLAELKVLKGMVSTLQDSHPILIIENGPYLNSIIEYLDSYEYKPYQYDQKKNQLKPSGANAVSMNVFFVPSARLGWLGSLICKG